tara:strand:- start:23314 stop:23724 length:411 start_codon:yes stop_codon:yes gene_type:complete
MPSRYDRFVDSLSPLTIDSIRQRILNKLPYEGVATVLGDTQFNTAAQSILNYVKALKLASKEDVYATINRMVNTSVNQMVNQYLTSLSNSQGKQMVASNIATTTLPQNSTDGVVYSMDISEAQQTNNLEQSYLQQL